MQQLRATELPDFIIKSTLGVSATVLLILIPFTILSFIEARYLIGSLMAIIQILCIANIWISLKNQYHNGLNLFAIVILLITNCLGLYQIETLASYWPSLAVLSLYFILPQKQAQIANILFIIIISPIAFNILEPTIALRFFAVFLGISFFAFTSTHEIYKQHYRLKEQSITDNLTGLYNRSLLQDSLEKAIHQSDRANTDVTILMIDIDHFKMINDRFGHDIGDSVLKSTGSFLSRSFRTSDMVFRIGGEEFLALIYNTDKAGAISLAEKLRQEFEQLSLVNNHNATISIGVSSFQPSMDWKQWMKKGDERLYIAKSNGRNQVAA
ncbi:MAG: GGDEF domain-containing protein [Methylophagaceae bacterium]